MEKKKDNKKFLSELKRKAVHIFALLFVLCFYVVSEYFGEPNGKEFGLFALVFLLTAFLIMDYFRVELKKKIPFVWHFWREKEAGHFGGNIFLLSGIIIALAVFDFRIAFVAILMSVFGDTAAALVGIRFGRTWITKTRALEGILAEFIVNLIIGYFVLQNIYIIVVMAFVATVAESAVDILDDNFVVPVFAGFAGQAVVYLTKFLKF